MYRRWITAAAVLFAVACAPGHAQLKTKAAVTGEITSNLPDNTSFLITPAIMRGVLYDIVNSYFQGSTVNAQTGTTYTVQCADMGSLITFNNASAVAVSLPSAATTCFNNNWAAYFSNSGSGTVTITPTAGTIKGASNISLTFGQGIYVVSDGANYQVWSGAVFGQGTTSAKTGNYTASVLDCGNTILLGGNAQFNLTVLAASGYSTNCALRFINTDTYSGPGTGRGKVMAISGITQHILYPGQSLTIRQNATATAWVPDQPVNGNLGQIWTLGNGPTFFVDNAGSDTANDGLASGSAGSFQNMARCVAVVGQAQVTRNGSTTFCKMTAGQSITESVNIFYYIQAPIPFQIQSTVNGTKFTWNCPFGQICITFGDYGGAQLQDIAFVANNNPIIFGHQFGITDLETGISMAGNNGSFPLMTCDYEAHYNIMNGLTYSGNPQMLFNGCPKSTWNINGALTGSSSPTPGKMANTQTGASMVFQGNVTFVTPGTFGGASTATGNSVFINQSGATIPGGNPTPATGAQYCTATC